MKALRGDFIGFTYGSHHSSDLGIVRVSDGTRYSQELSPTISDQTTTISGRDGSYFFGSYYTQKPIELNFAFDHVDEQQFRMLQQVFNNKQPQKLIYDEWPYKYYLVKSISPPSLRYLCFDEEGERIYKGEGTLMLTAYYPYARSVNKYLDQYDSDNLAEWRAASGMLNTQGIYDIVSSINLENGVTSMINLYNCGDLNTHFNLKITPKSGTKIGSEDGINIFINYNEDVSTYQLGLKQITLKGNDDTISINSANNLIEGYSNGKRSGNLYNEYKVSGAFFQIPLGESQMNIVGIGSNNDISLTYDYLYY